MESVRLIVTRNESGAIFSCVKNGEGLAIEDWASFEVVTENGDFASPGLFSLLEGVEGYQESEDGKAISLSNSVIATLSPVYLKKLGLPPASQLRLKINSKKPLISTAFSISYGFMENNLPVHKLAITGAFVEVNKKEYTLLDPYFSIIQLIEEFRSAPIQDMDKRFQWWGKIKELLPADTDVSKFLGTLHVVTPTHFSVDFTESENGIKITPRFVTSELSSDDESSTVHSDLLPPAVSENFNQRFLGWRDVAARCAAKDKWFVVFSDTIQQALRAVHQVNSKSEGEKKAFLRNPRKAIREKLEEIDIPATQTEELLESLFVETQLFLSERVKCLGEWHPKKGLFIKTEGGQWLPDDGIPSIVGVPIGDQILEFETADLPELHEQMAASLSKGESELEFKGQNVPVSEQAVKSVGNAAKAFGPPKKPKPQGSLEDGANVKIQPHVPIIYDHIEELGIDVSEDACRELADVSEALKEGVQLHEHQVEGLSWLKSHWKYAGSGALLADDMGLGKTIQTLAFMSWVKEQMNSGMAAERPFLIVAPTGLLKNWEEEAEKFLPDSQLGMLVKAFGKSFSDSWKHGLASVTSDLQEAGWVLTTYETLRDKILAFTGINWSVVAFDEAQKIKNPRAMATEMAKSLKAEFTLAITGTPVENSLTDLWCIVDAVQPGRLDTLKNFAADYIPGGASSEEDLSRLKEQLEAATPASIMLRRSKDEHWKEKPEKSEDSIKVTMPAVQAEAYTRQVERAMQNKGKRGAMLEVLHGLRMTSLHPFFEQDIDDHDEFIQQSARLAATFKVLDKAYTQQEKVLIFVEYKEMQAKLAEIIQRKYNCPSVMLINGAISGVKRQQRVKEFQSSGERFEVMMLSPKAGGVGLTLTAATHVIHLTRWWNPAVEDQCTDRAYRIGQRKNVTVHYPIAIHPEYGEESSFDMKLHELLESKRVLSKTLLAPPAATRRDTESLFNATVSKESTMAKEDYVDLERIDIMEPTEFERFVHTRFSENYTVRETPVSGDGGADGICLAKKGSGLQNIILQCKHTQGDGKISTSAVEEVLVAKKRYPDVANADLWVITNGYFDARAIQLADENAVRLIDRSELVSFAV